ncbi:MAG: hypothetical protein BAA04_12885 [Firmicutes bacterium ZCTH02-B6]|nr:MAG: hypothetical protein BAA04_12885 [Firmicutes bacterium ZCTH02-B6]
MVVLIVESAPPGLRGELSKWMLEPKAGVFVGKVSALVRELLYEKACREVETGGVTLIYTTNNEQGYAIRTFGDTSRQVEDWEGLFLVRRPKSAETGAADDGAAGEAKQPGVQDWNAMLHPVLWAKTATTGRWGVTLRPGESSWHPLIAHMIDVAMVALGLWQYLLPRTVKEQMTVSLGIENAEAAGRWVAYFIGLHDLGKATPGFAFQWPEAEERLLAAGFKPGSRGKAHHGFVSALSIPDILTRLGIARASAVAIGRAVGAHHGLFPDPQTLERLMIQELQGLGQRWRRAQEDLAAVLAHVLKVDNLPLPQGNLLDNSSFLIRLAGLTSVADWIGSNHDYFPFVGDKVRIPEYARLARFRSLRALIDLGWFHRPQEIEPKPFIDLFARSPNPLQTEVEKIADELHGPSLVLIEYPMGGGKTEAALYLANTLQALAGQEGFHVALPTMATSNQMFVRVAQYLACRFPGQPLNLQLIHGRADLNPSFARLLRRKRGLPDNPVIGSGGDRDANLMAAEWFTQKKHALLAPFGIGTIDQALLAALDVKHYFVRLFGLAGKVVIFDEVHAYDTYMQSLLAQLLTWLAACGSSVILLSATLPARTRRELVRAFSKGLGRPTSGEMPITPYPRISWVSSGAGGSRHIPAAPDRRVWLRQFDAQSTGWMSALKERLAGGGCAAVLCNTVKRAQETYQALLSYFPAEELILFHARYPFDDRTAIEETVLQLFGKGDDQRPHRMVCVVTQVIEQSLDIDFDIMVSELAPVDLILQRSGRVWRHPRAARPANIQAPELWLLIPPVSAEGVPEWDESTLYVYDEHVLFRSYLALNNLQSLQIPDDVEQLIESVYGESSPPEDLGPVLVSYWTQTEQRMRQQDLRKKYKAAIREIPDIDVQIIDYAAVGLEEDAEELHEAHRAMTRLGGPSVDVVCLYQRDGQVYATADAKEPLDLSRKPSPEEIMTLLGRSMRLSFNPSLVKRILQLPVPQEWEVTPHLRKHRLLLFAPDGACLTENLPLQLHPVLGLRQLAEETEVGT